jgi:hypothetical protein
VWHEKWGEDYDKHGDACVKYTDRWSETQQEDGRYVKQGDKWREDFGSGTGNKSGETWHEHADGSRCAAHGRVSRFTTPSLLGSAAVVLLRA